MTLNRETKAPNPQVKLNILIYIYIALTHSGPRQHVCWILQADGGSQEGTEDNDAKPAV